MTDISPLGTVDLLTATTSAPSPLALPPGDGEPLVPLSDPTWDQTVIDWLKQRVGPHVVDYADFRESIEHWRLPVLFHNCYVIFRDIIDSGEDHWRLVRREVYFHTTDFAATQKFLSRIPFDQLGQYELVWSDGNR